MPDFRMQPNSFPIASVIDAASRNAALQEQSRQAGNRALIEGLHSIGQVGQSLVDQKLKVAQALAQAKLFAQTPEGQQMLGTNQVAQTPMGPVAKNQAASFDPGTGAVTPNQSPNTIQSIATAMQGLSPKDFMDNMVQSRAARTQQGELDFRKQYKPQELGIESNKVKAEIENNAIMRQLQAMMGMATIKNQQAEREQAKEKAIADAAADLGKRGIFTKISDAISPSPETQVLRAKISGAADHKRAINWAKANPKDPRSAAILQKASSALNGN